MTAKPRPSIDAAHPQRAKPTSHAKPALAQPTTPANTAQVARHGGITGTTIGFLAAGALLLVLILALVERATRTAVGRDDVSLLDALAPQLAESPQPAATIAVQTNEHDQDGVHEPAIGGVEEPQVRAGAILAVANGHASARRGPAVANGYGRTALNVPAVANGDAPTGPETISITLWHGYVKSQFIARRGPAGDGPALAMSKLFRWRAGQAHQSEAVIRAHHELLAALAESGWRIDDHANNDQWYDLVLHRAEASPPVRRAQRSDEVPVPSPARR